MAIQLLSRYYDLKKSQGELDFVDVPVRRDIRLFVDPFALSLIPGDWAYRAHTTLVSYFDRLVSAIRRGRRDVAIGLLQNLHEPNETRLGLSRGRPQGAGIGKYQALELYDVFSQSAAVESGLISSISESELFIDGIGHDKISDLTTNIIRIHLIDYTREQSALHNIPTRRVALKPYYSAEEASWKSEYFDVPVAGGVPVLMVPKAIVRLSPYYDHRQFYNNYYLEFLQSEHLDANTSLVHTFKNQRRAVFKKTLRPRFPMTKEELFNFARTHPDVLEEYKSDLAGLQREGAEYELSAHEETVISKALIEALAGIPTGSSTASDYHNLMIGIMEFLFYPFLLCPKKEQEINQRRKRIDIVMDNCASSGVFHRIPNAARIQAYFIVIECKNYSSDPANPELDQLIGRFSTNRGKVGILCCRRFENKELFVERCRDTLRDGHGLIIPLDDVTIVQCLEKISNNEREDVNLIVDNIVEEIFAT